MRYTARMSRQYVTTAIDYANAAPHMGHVMEKIMADVIARWFRLRGDEVRFQVGMDEHGVKVQRTAAKAGVEPQAFVSGIAPFYIDLYKRLGISHDAFIRTTDRAVHWPTVVALWQKLAENGALEKRSYTGLYCQGCERFLTKRDLEDGLCPIHKAKPEEVTEENWFFLMKKREKFLKGLLTEKGGYAIVPDFRAPETLSLIEQGLEDVSFSRPKSSLSWGIPVPGDENQTMYVWCDALTNYISGLGLLTDHAQPQFWDDATVTHVIGKDIARFHALIWPAMLDYAGIKTPDRLLIHGFLTSEGQKMSKTIGNVVVPEDVLAHFNGNPDPLRFYLSHEIPVGNDGDFSWKRIDEVYDSKLRNQLGNLLNRVLVLLSKIENKISVGTQSNLLAGDDVENRGEGKSLAWTRYEKDMDSLDTWSGVQRVFNWLEACNKHITVLEPWKISEVEDRRRILSNFAENLRHISLQLLPFVPQTAQRMAMQLNLPYADTMLDKDFVITPQMKEWGGAKEWTRVGEPEILFAPLEK